MVWEETVRGDVNTPGTGGAKNDPRDERTRCKRIVGGDYGQTCDNDRKLVAGVPVINVNGNKATQNMPTRVCGSRR